VLSATVLDLALREARQTLAELKAAELSLSQPGEMFRARGRQQLRAAVLRLERGIRQAELFRA
jgi:hypothetical protein